jgi:hypothetical protein
MYEPDAEQINAVVINNDMLEALQSLTACINSDEIPVQISPLGMFCQKTGHLIGNRTENSLFSLVKQHGRDYAIWALYNCTSLNVHPAWIETNETDLDALANSDPIGYACYCFGLLTAQYYQNKRNRDPKKLDGSERYWAMARANALLHEKGVHDLEELNIALCRVVSFMPGATNALYNETQAFANAPDTLALLHCSGELIEKLNNAVNAALDSIGYSKLWVKSTSLIDIPTTPETAARGPSNVRRQKTSKRSIAEASMFFEMEKLFAEAGLNLPETIGANTPGTSAWRKKWAAKATARQEEQENIMIADFAELAKISNLALFSDDDAGDPEENTVEVRTMSNWTPPVSVELKPEPEPEPKIEPAKPMTALQLMRAKRQGK